MGDTIPIEVDAEAWRAEPGPILLLAGPGTGNTHQLARRAKYLVQDRRVSPEAITVITFTREAAENMRRRMADEENPDVYLPPESRPDRITTMHSLGLDIVRTHCGLLALPDKFHVLTDSKLRAVLFRDAAFLAGYGEREAEEADRLRRQSVLPPAGSSLEKIIERYEGILRACGAVDYDDQITLACRLLLEQSEVRAKYVASAQHLLVDEYQDINAGQRQLIELLSKGSRQGLFAVGDDDQSIYGFRGGNPQFIRKFHHEFGGEARVLCLVESRRCTDMVIYAGLSVVKTFDPNCVDKPAPTFSEKKQHGVKVQVHDVPSDDREAEMIGNLTRKALPKNTVLILIPARQYAAKLRRALRKRGIAYTHPLSLDDSGFLILHLIYTWTQNPHDNFALRHCIEALCQSGAVRIPSKNVKKPELKEKRTALLKQIAGLWEVAIEKGVPLWTAVETAAQSGLTLLGELHSKLNDLRSVQADDVSGFLKITTEHLRPWHSRDQLMEELGAWVDELRTHAQHSEGGVRIMTLQAAKGLEANVVCVVGLTERILPRGNAEEEEIAEFARLTYVSMTRAITELHLFHARKRDASITYLKDSFNLKPSRFVEVISPAHKEKHYVPPG